eukprot:g2674.t1
MSRELLKRYRDMGVTSETRKDGSVAIHVPHSRIRLLWNPQTGKTYIEKVDEVTQFYDAEGSQAYGTTDDEENLNDFYDPIEEDLSTSKVPLPNPQIVAPPQPPSTNVKVVIPSPEQAPPQAPNIQAPLVPPPQVPTPPGHKHQNTASLPPQLDPSSLVPGVPPPMAPPL